LSLCEALHALGFPCSARRFKYTYYLSFIDLWHFLSISLGVTFLDAHFVPGWPAVVKTFLFTFFILAVAGVLTKFKVRLQF
jgi:hypothetical protein